MAWPEGKLEFQRGLVEASNSPLPAPSRGLCQSKTDFSANSTTVTSAKASNEQAGFAEVIAS